MQLSTRLIIYVKFINVPILLNFMNTKGIKWVIMTRGRRKDTSPPQLYILWHIVNVKGNKWAIVERGR